jgi:hypothetical protein
MDQLFVIREIDYITIGRVFLAFVLGGLVGFERERTQRPAGLRTHMLVAAGSACFTVASIYGFQGLGVNSDPARLAAQIITGIGFLGAGAIFRTGDLDYGSHRHCGWRGHGIPGHLYYGHDMVCLVCGEEHRDETGAQAIGGAQRGTGYRYQCQAIDCADMGGEPVTGH